MGVRVLLDPVLAPALAAAGLTAPDRLFALGGEGRGFVGTFVADVRGTTGRFHVKRYRYGGWRESWGLLGRGTLWGVAPEVNEFRALAWLRERAIPAVRPVAAAFRRRAGRLVEHVLVTEHVPDAVDLARRLDTAGDPVREDVAVRRRVLDVLARHLARMHAEGFVHRDCHARNVLVRVTQEDPRIWFCDCRRGGRASWRRGPDDDLAALDGDLEGRVPATDRLRGLRSWCGETADLRGTCARVRRRRT